MLAPRSLRNAFNWLTFVASVPFMPGATFVRRRSLPAEPTDTVLS